jgi:hypothetical protein
MYYLELFRASEGTISHWPLVHLQLALTELHWPLKVMIYLQVFLFISTTCAPTIKVNRFDDYQLTPEINNLS